MELGLQHAQWAFGGVQASIVILVEIDVAYITEVTELRNSWPGKTKMLREHLFHY